jgi:hypothetical protein
MKIIRIIMVGVNLERNPILRSYKIMGKKK